MTLDTQIWRIPYPVVIPPIPFCPFRSFSDSSPLGSSCPSGRMEESGSVTRRRRILGPSDTMYVAKIAFLRSTTRPQCGAILLWGGLAGSEQKPLAAAAGLSCPVASVSHCQRRLSSGFAQTGGGPVSSINAPGQCMSANVSKPLPGDVSALQRVCVRNACLLRLKTPKFVTMPSLSLEYQNQMQLSALQTFPE